MVQMTDLNTGEFFYDNVAAQPKDRVALSDAEVRVPAGAELLFRQEFKPGRPQYIRYAIQGATWKERNTTAPAQHRNERGSPQGV